MTSLPSPRAAAVTSEGEAAAVVAPLAVSASLPAVMLSPSASSPLSGGAGGEEGKTRRGKGGGGAKAKSKAELAERRKQEQINAEVARAQSLASARWSDCLQCLSSSLPLLQANPFLCILQPPFLYDYLDSLTETLANLTQHADELSSVRSLLHAVYNSFIELGRFAKYQPAFFIDDSGSLKRFIRLMEQVSHRQSDKALFPNILSLLTPTFTRSALYPLLLELQTLRCLLSFALNQWIPSTPTSLMIFAILEEMTQVDDDCGAGEDGAEGAAAQQQQQAAVAASAGSAALSGGWLVRRALQAEPGWERLCKLCWGREPGLSKEQQARGQQALQWAEADLPDDWKQGTGEDEDEDDDEQRAGAGAAAISSSDEQQLTAGKPPPAAATAGMDHGAAEAAQSGARAEES